MPFSFLSLYLGYLSSSHSTADSFAFIGLHSSPLSAAYVCIHMRVCGGEGVCKFVPCILTLLCIFLIFDVVCSLILIISWLFVLLAFLFACLCDLHVASFLYPPLPSTHFGYTYSTQDSLYTHTHFLCFFPRSSACILVCRLLLSSASWSSRKPSFLLWSSFDQKRKSISVVGRCILRSSCPCAPTPFPVSRPLSRHRRYRINQQQLRHRCEYDDGESGKPNLSGCELCVSRGPPSWPLVCISHLRERIEDEGWGLPVVWSCCCCPCRLCHYFTCMATERCVHIQITAARSRASFRLPAAAAAE